MKIASFGFRLKKLFKKGHNHGTEADDFLFGYQFKAPTPNIQHLLKKGTKAETRLIPIFLTPHLPQPLLHRQRALPSPPCIVNNVFFDPLTGEKFTMKSHSWDSSYDPYNTSTSKSQCKPQHRCNRWFHLSMAPRSIVAASWSSYRRAWPRRTYCEQSLLENSLFTSWYLHRL